MAIMPEGLHGAHLRAELAEYVGASVLRTLVREGRLVSFSRSVVVDARRAADFPTRAAAGLLHVGPHAVLTGPSALALHGCTAAGTGAVHMVVPYECKARRRPGLVLHHGRYDDQDVLDIAGLRTLALDVALAEALSRDTRRTGLACADQALRLVSEEERAEFGAWVEERIRTRPDPRGRRQARSVLALATGLAESPAESWMLLALVDGGLPLPEQQYPITDLSGRELYRLDFAWSGVRVAVEYDGYEAHEAKQEADAARDADLRRRGWMVIRATASDLANPWRVISEVQAAFRRRGLAA
ncbi:endonuclease domain-containing protein [Prauserella muralis]|uniref:Uncharacterized protein n=1 Tax=Prauserella muralis TaxID=588067 RepID=A0A2V4BB13_9PSEU|nr:DUF559 domain-containing protein [Prauserella muralis]PXY32336.1 hypothetical protein BAY60_08680 [Prauserella muralis]TWE23984.1 uncharacterized protein DUF559 [Prauserella muralis]